MTEHGASKKETTGTATMKLISPQMTDAEYHQRATSFQEHDPHHEIYHRSSLDAYEDTEQIFGYTQMLFGNNGHERFQVVNVAGDGHCGYYVLLMFLCATGRKKRMSVVNFRRHCLEILEEKLDAYSEFFEMNFGESQYVELVESIYSDEWEREACVPRVGSGYHLDQTLLAVFSDLFKINVVVVTHITALPRTRNNIRGEHKTIQAWCRECETNKLISMGFNADAPDDSSEWDPEHKAFISDHFNAEQNHFRKLDTLYIVYTGAHYLWIRPKHVETF